MFISLALTSASFAVACPIDLAPCEVATLPDVAGLDPNETIRPINGSAEINPLQTALLDEQPNTAPTDRQAAKIPGDSECWDITAALSMFPAEAQEADASIDVDITGTGAAGAVSSLKDPELALDGYEDRGSSSEIEKGTQRVCVPRVSPALSRRVVRRRRLNKAKAKSMT